MRLLSFTRHIERPIVQTFERGVSKLLASQDETATEYYELVDVSEEELKAWAKIAEEIQKLGIWLQWNVPMPKPPRVIGRNTHGPIFEDVRYEVSISIEYRHGFNIQDHFNKVLRIDNT